MGDREVELAGFPRSELMEEGLQGLITLGGYDAAAGLLVEAVDYAGSFDSADCGKVSPAVMKECVDESPIGIAGRRVDHESNRFVDHSDMIIFVENVQGDVLGEDFGGAGFGKFHRNMVARRHRGPCPRRFTIEEDMATLEKGLDA